MTRNERLDAALEPLDQGDNPEDTNASGVRLNPERFLLVENNLGSASGIQPHYFTTHASLEAAGGYNADQDNAHEWEIHFALDLDTGEQYEGTPYITIGWGRAPEADLLDTSERLARVRSLIEEAQRAVPSSGVGTYAEVYDALGQAWGQVTDLLGAEIVDALEAN